MSEYSVSKILEEISAPVNEDGTYSYKRFNKKNFESLIRNLVNDPDYKFVEAKIRDGQMSETEQISVYERFREFLQKVLEQFGVDKKESKKVLDSDFEIKSVQGLYELMVVSIYEFIKVGNRFQFLDTEDFHGSLYVKKVPETTKVTSARSPQTGEPLGDFEINKKAHYELMAKSSCPPWLRNRIRVVPKT